MAGAQSVTNRRIAEFKSTRHSRDSGLLPKGGSFHARPSPTRARRCVGPKRAKLLDGQKVVANLDGVLDSLSDPVLVWEDAP
jgi:hypothetical protein